jgi:ABC-type glycerol-3-phosphate transport system substrate-binding protein
MRRATATATNSRPDIRGGTKVVTKNRMHVALITMVLLLAACSTPGSPSANPGESAAESAAASPTAAFDVEEGAEITFWTFWLSPTFDEFIDATIDSFEAEYPGVTVTREDHQATFLEDFRLVAGSENQPDVANLSNNEGWVREFAEAGHLLNLTENLPQEVQDLYFPGLFNDSLVDDASYQIPWYQAIPVEIVNTQIFEDAGLSVDDFPGSFDELPALCQTIFDETGKLCDIRLTVSDYLAQMTYEGGVDVMNEDGTAFTFDSQEAVDWLQVYVDMVAAGIVDRAALTTADDRVALELFTSGQAPFYQTGPNLIREVKESNPDLYANLAIAPFPIGRSGVIGPTSQGIAVKADTEFPQASMALAAWFTNAANQLAFAKIVPIYPSTPASFDDPFFAEEPELVEDSARPLAFDLLSHQENILPSIPNKADVNEIVRRAVEAAIFDGADPQEALSAAVTEANALLE